MRLADNMGLFHALKSGHSVLPVFIFDTNILGKLEDEDDRRVDFIHQTLCGLNSELEQAGSALCVQVGAPTDVYKKLLDSYNVQAVYTNHDYEPYAIQRDKEIAELLKENGIVFRTFKDQVVLEKSEVVKDDGAPYTVYTPYMKKWKATVTDADLASVDSEALLGNCLQGVSFEMPTLQSLGFRASGAKFPPRKPELQTVQEYHKHRDYPHREGTTHLGIHLRFGTVSIRALSRFAKRTNETFFNELIWRNFFQTILWHFPHVVGNAFKPAYDQIAWRTDEQQFEKWCRGETGYPLVDAGMRELLHTGFMHNRVRMVTASFLTRHLFLDWRLGEAWFARHLLDFDLASNNGNWQWAAGSGCDAAPYFRIFNPTSQAKKFDPQRTYIKRWVPEVDELTYPTPIVEHKFARERALVKYKEGLGRS